MHHTDKDDFRVMRADSACLLRRLVALAVRTGGWSLSQQPYGQSNSHLLGHHSFQFSQLQPVFSGYLLEIFNGVALWFVWPFQPINLVLPDAPNQFCAVWPEIPGLRHVAVAVALEMDI